MGGPWDGTGRFLENPGAFLGVPTMWCPSSESLSWVDEKNSNNCGLWCIYIYILSIVNRVYKSTCKWGYHLVWVPEANPNLFGLEMRQSMSFCNVKAKKTNYTIVCLILRIDVISLIMFDLALGSCFSDPNVKPKNSGTS